MVLLLSPILFLVFLFSWDDKFFDVGWIYYFLNEISILPFKKEKVLVSKGLVGLEIWPIGLVAFGIPTKVWGYSQSCSPK